MYTAYCRVYRKFVYCVCLPFFWRWLRSPAFPYVIISSSSPLKVLTSSDWRKTHCAVPMCRSNEDKICQGAEYIQGASKKKNWNRCGATSEQDPSMQLWRHQGIDTQLDLLVDYSSGEWWVRSEVVSPVDVNHQGGYSDLSWTGVCARASKPLPIFKGDFGRKGYPFLRIFPWKLGPFFKNFAIFATRKPENLGSVRKV